MKKYFYSAIAASMLFACSQEEIVDITGGESQVKTFKVEIPQLESRTVGGIEIGKGTQANTLIYAMYENDEDPNTPKETTPLITGVVTDEGSDGVDNGEFIVKVPMAKDLKYDLLFFAYNADKSAFEIASEAKDTDLKNLKFKADQTANIDAFDAFVGSLKAQGVNDPNTVDLKRPFAQINAATTEADLDNATTLKLNVTKSNLVIKGVPQCYDVLNATASGSVDVTYAAFPIMECDGPNASNQAYPNEMIEVDGTNYYYLTLAYVLAGEVTTTSTHNATFEFQRENGQSVSTLEIVSLPIQRNFRTNVIGDLLTKSEEYTISIDAEFGGAHEVDPTVQQPTDEAGLKYILEKVSDGDVIQLAGDITLTEALNIPAGLEVTLDLNENTLTGSILALNADLTIENGTLTNANPDASAIEINAGSLTLDNVSIESGRHAVRIDGDVTATINGGTYTVTPASNLTLHALNVSGNANVTVNGGTFVGPKGTSADSGAAVCVQAGSTVTINGGNFSGGKNSTLVTKPEANLIVAGGTFDQDPSAYVAEDYKAMLEDGYYYVVADDATGVIRNAADLLALGGSTSAEGIYSIVADIDLNNVEMSTIGAAYGKSLTIIGNGHTIKNAKLAHTSHNGMKHYGLFYAYTNSTLVIEDLIVENVNADCTNDTERNYGVGVMVAYADGGSNVTLNNVDVHNCTLINNKAEIGDEAGVYVGYQTGTLTMNNCNSTGCSVAGETAEKTGAFIGMVGNSSTAYLNNCTTDLTIGACNRVNGSLYIDGKRNVKVTTADALKTAISNAQDNDVIVLADGTYTGLFTISGKNLTLKAVNKDMATIDGMIFGEGEKTIKLDGLTLKRTTNYDIPNTNAGGHSRKPIVIAYQNNFEIEDCTFDMEGDAVYGFYDESNDANNYNTIKNCTFICNGKRPIQAKTNITVDGCIFDDQYKYAMQLIGQGDVTYTSKVIFTNNVFTNACKTTNNSIQGISISKNHVFKNVEMEIKGNTSENVNYVYDNGTNVTDYWNTVTVTGDVTKESFIAVD